MASSPSRITASHRHGGRGSSVAGRDLEAREHLGLERAVGIGDLRAHHDAPRRRVGRRADRGDARLEHAVRQRGDLDLDLLADADDADVVFRHLGLEPHGGEIGDRIERLAGIVAHILARTDLAGDDGAVDRRMDRRRAAAPCPSPSSVATSSSVRPTMRSRCARGFERHFGRAHVVLGADQLPPAPADIP